MSTSTTPITSRPDRRQQGIIEQPFFYIYDATHLTDGVDVTNSSLPLDGTYNFQLRRIVGVPSVCRSFNIRDDVNHQPLCWSPSGRGEMMSHNYAMAQSWQFKATSFFTFDLFSVDRQVEPCAPQHIYTGFIGFQGAKLVPQEKVYDSRYNWCPWPYELVFTLNLDWKRYVSNPGPVEIPRAFHIPIVNYDFELQRICVIDITTPGNPFEVVTSDFQLSLFNTYGVSLSNLPIPIEYLNSIAPPPFLSNFHMFDSVFPVPTIVYQKDSFLRFDVTSLICNADPNHVYQICFKGRQRLPI